MEGLVLVLVFTSVWLWYFRKECRFPQALLLIPVAMLCIWLLNIVRLSALVFIGDTISPEIATVGFHSHVGWIAFIIVALTFFVATQRLSWVRKEPSPGLAADGRTHNAGPATGQEMFEQPREERGESPAIRAYLVPFLAILAASFVSKAASGNFEWLYPLRFVVALIALKHYWPELKKLNWRVGWLAPLCGVAVFLVWIAPSWLAHQQVVSPIGSALAALSPAARWSWIAFRCVAAIVTVPIAEELAFRGYLARRFISREFEQISFSGLTVLPVALSSVAFGMMHMQNLGDWRHLALGTLAGLAFAGVLRWKGRMGDAVAAHATCNLLLAAWVLGFGDWAQW
jgi:exosortase E/protease (VPEID-CTERM system)